MNGTQQGEKSTQDRNAQNENQRKPDAAGEAVSGVEQEESGAGYGNNAGEQGSEAEHGQ